MVSSSQRSDRLPLSSSSLSSDLAALRIDRSRKRGSGRIFKLLGSLLVLGALGAGAAAAWHYRDQFKPLPEVTTDTVRVMTVGQASTVLTATGYLESRWQAAVGAKGAGRIEKITFDEGKKVSKGELLAVLEHAEIDAALASRRVAVLQAEADLEEADTLLKQKERNYKREKSVWERGAGTEAALETSETDFLSAKAHVNALKAAIRAAEARVVEAEEMVKNMYVYAPFSGTVITKDAEVGETIMPGGMGLASGRGSVATIADLEHLEVETDVKEDFLAQISRGQPADIEVDAVPGRIYRGRLREIIPIGDRSRGIVKVKVEVLSPDEHLFPDLSATVNFLPEKKESASEASSGAAEERVTTPITIMYVPERAVITSAGQSYVWRLEENDRAWRVPIVPDGDPKDGLIPLRAAASGAKRPDAQSATEQPATKSKDKSTSSNGDAGTTPRAVEISSSRKLGAGDVLILNPPADLVDGARVRVPAQ